MTLNLISNDHVFYNHIYNVVSDDISIIYKLNQETLTKEIIYNYKNYNSTHADDRSHRYDIDLFTLYLNLNNIIYIEKKNLSKIFYKKLGDNILETIF